MQRIFLPFLSILIFLIGNELVGVTLVTGCDISRATLTVNHKLTKKTVLTFQNVLVNSKEDSVKAGLYLSSPLDACTAVDALPNNTAGLHSLRGSVEWRFAILLVEDINCDATKKFKNAHGAGYSGIILYSDERNNGVWDVASTPSLFLALISLSQGQSLKKFAKNSYNLQFTREPSLTEKLYTETAEVVKIFYDSGIKVGRWLYQNLRHTSGIIWELLFYVFQVSVLLSPLLFLLLMVKREVQPLTPGYEDYSFFFASNSREESYWERENNAHDESSSDDEESLRRYRDFLGVEVGATRREIETEFRRISFEFHPDKNMHLSEEERERRTTQFKNLSCAKIALLKSLEQRQPS